MISLFLALSPQNTHLCSPEPPGVKFKYPEVAILERPGVRPQRHRERLSCPLPPFRSGSKASGDPRPRPASHPEAQTSILSLECRFVSKIIASLLTGTVLELYVVQKLQLEPVRAPSDLEVVPTPAVAQAAPTS